MELFNIIWDFGVILLYKILHFCWLLYFVRFFFAVHYSVKVVSIYLGFPVDFLVGFSKKKIK